MKQKSLYYLGIIIPMMIMIIIIIIISNYYNNKEFFLIKAGKGIKTTTKGSVITITANKPDKPDKKK